MGMATVVTELTQEAVPTKNLNCLARKFACHFGSVIFRHPGFRLGKRNTAILAERCLEIQVARVLDACRALCHAKLPVLKLTQHLAEGFSILEPVNPLVKERLRERSEERRVGKEGVRKWRSRLSPYT